MIKYIIDPDKGYSKDVAYTMLSMEDAGLIHSEGWRFKSRLLDFYKILHVVRGKLNILLDDQRYEVCESQLIVLPPYRRLASSEPTEGAVHFFWIDFRYETHEMPLQHPVMRKFANPLSIEQQLSEICEAGWQRQHSHINADALLLHLLASLQQDVTLSGSQIILVRRVCRFIQDNLQHAPTVSSVAKEMGYAPDHLTRLFRMHSGISLNEYIINVRLNAAKALLSSSAYTVNEISEQLGCENANRFTKFFKYHTGISPQEYRKTH